MAYVDNYSKNKLDWAMPFQRTGTFPLDRSSIFSSYADAVKYASGNATDSRALGGTSYIGQIVSVVGPGADGTTEEVAVYQIISAGNLQKLAATTASGDISQDLSNLISSLPITKQANGTYTLDAPTANKAGFITKVQADKIAAAASSSDITTAINIHNSATNSHSDIRNQITALAEKVSGKKTAYVYTNKSDTKYTAAVAAQGSFSVGDTIYFIDTNISDQWVVSVNETNPYYTFQDIETEKTTVSLDGYVKGTGLTTDTILLGGGGSTIKTGSKTISTAIAAADTDNKIPTNKAVVDYIKGQNLGKVDDVQIKDKGTTDFTSVLDSKVAKIDLGSYAKIDIANNFTQAISAPIVGVTQALKFPNNDKIISVISDKAPSEDITVSLPNHGGTLVTRDDLGDAAAKNVDSTLDASSNNLPTSKAVADYVAEQTTATNKVKDVQVDSASIVDDNGIANIDTTGFAKLSNTNKFTKKNVFNNTVQFTSDIYLKGNFILSGDSETKLYNNFTYLGENGSSFRFPDDKSDSTSYTLATTADIPDTRLFAKTNEENSFMKKCQMADGCEIFDLSLLSSVIKYYDFSYTMPSASGTLALTSDNISLDRLVDATENVIILDGGTSED